MPINLVDYLEQYEKYFFDVNEIDLVILRGHLILEEMLYKIICEYVFHSNYIEDAKLSFSQKVYVSRSISLDESKNSMWELILAINALRNKIVHQLLSEKMSYKLDKVKNLYINESKDMPRQYSWDSVGDMKGIKFAISLCIGFLHSFDEEVKRFKTIINDLGEIYHPHRHNK